MERPIEYDPEWMESSYVSRVALDRGQALIRVDLGPQGTIARIFSSLSGAGVRVDVIAAGVESGTVGFTVASVDRERAVRVLATLPIAVEHSLAAKLSLEGVGFGAQSDAMAALLQTLARAQIEPRLISTSVRAITIVLSQEKADEAFALACRAFGFPDETEE